MIIGGEYLHFIIHKYVGIALDLFTLHEALVPATYCINLQLKITNKLLLQISMLYFLKVFPDLQEALASNAVPRMVISWSPSGLILVQSQFMESHPCN
jgi:hypothetical protein